MATQAAQIVVAPFTIYLAPVGTAFPKIDDADATITGAGWTKLGTNGAKNYSDAGVTLSLTGTESTFTPAGSTAPQKAWRTDESIKVSFDLADLTPAQVALVMDNLAVSTVVASTSAAGEANFELMRGNTVHPYALVARGVSSVDDALNSQVNIPSCFQSGNPAPKFAPKGGPALLSLEFTALEYTAGVLAQLHEQTAAKT